jgi:putative hydrolase of the HAD superfamily
MRYRAVVFDLWNTLVVWPVLEDGKDVYARMAEHVGVERERFTEVWWQGRHEREVGALVPSIRATSKELGFEERHVEGLVRIRHDFTREVLVPRPGALEVLDELRARGLRLGLISVCSEEVPALWEETPLAERIDAPVFSCSVGVRKPDEGIYRIAAERLDVAPRECLFVDDQPAFVEGARTAGMDAVLIASPEGAPEPPGVTDWRGPRIERLEDVLELAQ